MGIGYAPFWLDESTFGYIRQIPLSSNINRHELVLLGHSMNCPGHILTETDLQQALPDGDSDTYAVTTIRTFPTSHRSTDFYLSVRPLNDREIAVFSYHIQTKLYSFFCKRASTTIIRQCVAGTAVSWLYPAPMMWLDCSFQPAQQHRLYMI